MNYIFDFDGTIVDSFDYVLGFLSDEAGVKKPSGPDAEKYRNMSMKDMSIHLGIPIWRLPFVYFKGRRVMRARMDNLQPFYGVEQLITKLVHDDHKLYIISSNSSRNIKRFLITQNFSQYFWAVWGGAGILGKKNLIKQMRFRYHIKEPVVYVGDEVRDVIAAKAAGIRVVAVTWGFADKKELIENGADYVIEHPKDLLGIKL